MRKQHNVGYETTDPYNLERFVGAQQGSYTNALAEIRRGAKRGHWMWFIFPQLRGLGRNATAEHYGISSLDEARAYLDHPLLGKRLLECVEALQDLTAETAEGIFGDIDALKLRSSLTLFAMAGGGPIFEAAIDRWFASRDQKTEQMLSKLRRSPQP